MENWETDSPFFLFWVLYKPKNGGVKVFSVGVP